MLAARHNNVAGRRNGTRFARTRQRRRWHGRGLRRRCRTWCWTRCRCRRRTWCWTRCRRWCGSWRGCRRRTWCWSRLGRWRRRRCRRRLGRWRRSWCRRRIERRCRRWRRAWCRCRLGCWYRCWSRRRWCGWLHTIVDNIRLQRVVKRNARATARVCRAWRAYTAGLAAVGRRHAHAALETKHAQRFAHAHAANGRNYVLPAFDYNTLVCLDWTNLRITRRGRRRHRRGRRTRRGNRLRSRRGRRRGRRRGSWLWRGCWRNRRTLRVGHLGRRHIWVLLAQTELAQTRVAVAFDAAARLALTARSVDNRAARHRKRHKALASVADATYVLRAERSGHVDRLLERVNERGGRVAQALHVGLKDERRGIALGIERRAADCLVEVQLAERCACVDRKRKDLDAVGKQQVACTVAAVARKRKVGARQIACQTRRIAVV